MSRALRVMILSSTVLLGALPASLYMALRQRSHPSLRLIRTLVYDNWGLYSLFQLQVGLLLAAAWILCVHRRKSIALLWILGIAAVGHIATLAYILLRAASARTVTEVLLPQAAPIVANPPVPVIHACDGSFNVELPDPSDSAAPPDEATPRPSKLEESA